MQILRVARDPLTRAAVRSSQRMKQPPVQDLSQWISDNADERTACPAQQNASKLENAMTAAVSAAGLSAVNTRPYAQLQP